MTRCIVAGLGVMGSAVAAHLAQAGVGVHAFDRFHPPHTFGSSHGATRIIREAYFEHPVYVPMVQRAYELWHALEQTSGMPLYARTGGLMIGAPDSVLVQGSLRSAREHGLAHEVLDAPAMARRFPALQPEPHMIGVMEPRAGVLFAERSVEVLLDAARTAGAELRFDMPIVRWEADAHGVRAFAADGEHRADWLIVTAGAWLRELVPSLAPLFRVERQALCWLDPLRDASVFAPARCPIHLWQFDAGHFFYGFPDLAEGIKLARHHHGATTSPGQVDREVSVAEIEDIRALARRFVPAAAGPLRKAAVCLYTNTRDEHFWIDRHPAHERVLIVSPCSGHGFKFAPVIGEIVADLVLERRCRFDLALFRARSDTGAA